MLKSKPKNKSTEEIKEKAHEIADLIKKNLARYPGSTLTMSRIKRYGLPAEITRGYTHQIPRSLKKARRKILSEARKLGIHLPMLSHRNPEKHRVEK